MQDAQSPIHEDSAFTLDAGTKGQITRARQEAITTELLDVVAGFEAVSGKNL